MKANIHNKPLLGGGIYTLPDVADILRIPYHKVSRCVKDYWDARLATDVENQYSWTNGKSRAVSFYTLIELFVYIQLTDAGVRTKDVLKAHLELSQLYGTPYPFATPLTSNTSLPKRGPLGIINSNLASFSFTFSLSILS